MAQNESDQTAISEDSVAFLEEVKKGKTRKFAMICKGTSIVSLVVYKKGNVEKHKKEAKQAGKGQFYFGVVDGKGQDIRFVLSREDGFDSAPVKTTVLKSFLDESADLKCKPVFEIVEIAPIVLDEDDPLVARFLKLRDTAIQTCETHPDRAVEINTLCRQIGSHFELDQPDQAEPKLIELEMLLKGLGEGGASVQPSNDSALEAKLVEALKKFKPLLEKALTLQPNRKAELLGAVAKVRDEIKAARFTQAQTDVIALGKLLKALVIPAPDSGTTRDPREAKWLGSFAKVEPIVLAALKTNPFGDEAGLAKFRKAWDWAVNCAADGDFDKALAALPKVLEMLKQARASGTSAPQVDINPEVKPFAEARLTWRTTRNTMHSELRKLQDAIVSVCEGDDELQTVADNVGDLAHYLVRLDERLEDKLDEIVNAEAGPIRENLKIEARKLLDEYQQELGNEFFVDVDNDNGFANVAVASTAIAALASISRVLS